MPVICRRTIHGHGCFKIMKKTDLFFARLSEVEKATEIPRGVILSDARSEEVVDARALLIMLLHENGFYSKEIAGMVGRHVSNIRRTVADFPYRLKGSAWLRQLYCTLSDAQRKPK